MIMPTSAPDQLIDLYAHILHVSLGGFKGLQRETTAYVYQSKFQ